MPRRWVYFFGDGSADGDPERKDLLGGKGASLAAMSRAGLPVPPGFTISTEACPLFLESDGQWPDGLREQVDESLGRLERATGRRFGDPDRPLLVSVRSGAAVSMPGMMDTILNCGLSPAMADSQPDPAGFWRVYGQFVTMFARTVADLDAAGFEAVERALRAEGGDGDAPLSAERGRLLAEAYMRRYAERAGRGFATDPADALTQCIEAVFGSWNNERAITYRRENDIPGLAGTAVNVQSMFASEISGIVFTANPNDLAANEMIIESSYGPGEAVVSGDVHPALFVIDRADRSVKRRQIGHKASVVSALGAAAPRDPDAPSLTDEQIAELVDMSLRVEELFGKPMDIEFGWAGGEFALLQARAVRGLEVAEDVEIGRQEEIHRLRTVAGDGRSVWVLHNLAETLPAPTPLTWDIVRGFMSGSGGFGKMYTDFGYRPSQRVRKEGFLELICGRAYADCHRAAEMFWDGIPLTYDLDQVSGDPKLLDAAPTAFAPERADGRFLLALPGFVRGLLRSRRLMKAARRDAVGAFEQDALPPYLNWVAAKRAQDLTALATADVLTELAERIDRVLSDFGAESLKPGFFGGAAQAAVEARLSQLMGEKAGKQLTLTLTQGLDGDTTLAQNQALCDVARGPMTLDEFMDAYGHRGVEEMELSRPRWREDPSYVRQVLGAYVDGTTPSPRQLHDRNADLRRQKQRELPAILAEWGGSCLLEDIQADLADAQALLPYRETGKHYLMMGYETIRLAILELARRWGLGRDVFFLRYDELTGEPVAAGAATGTAQIVLDPTQTADLCADYILVCHSTDPGWTALFARA
ncbi:MAG: PEP/pyruvate-binding domain-containing protein, partial [Planctomycetota bacterium]